MTHPMSAVIPDCENGYTKSHSRDMVSSTIYVPHCPGTDRCNLMGSVKLRMGHGQESINHMIERTNPPSIMASE